MKEPKRRGISRNNRDGNEESNATGQGDSEPS